MSAWNLFLLLAQLAAFVFAGFALGVILGLADRLADGVRHPRKLFDFRLQLAALRFEVDEPSDVGLHAAVDRSSLERARDFRG